MNGVILSKVFSMSLIGTYSILVVLAARYFLMKVKRKYAYYLWMIVFVNLALPVSFHSPVSLIPRQVAGVNPIGQEVSERQAIPSEAEEETRSTMVVLSENGLVHEEQKTEAPADGISDTEPGKTAPVSAKNVLLWAERIWLAGIGIFALYSTAAAIRLNWKIRRSFAVCRDEKCRIVEMEEISSPFLWGFLHPTIYLPTDMEEKERAYIIAHEACHRSRRDHLVKISVYAVTVLHWFNPLVWLAYSLCCKDMEISCDEAVLERSGKNIRKAYAESLLKYAAKQNGYVMTPLTFGEPSVRSRIEHVLRYRKKSIAVSALAIVLTVLVAMGLLMRPDDESLSGTEPEGVVSGQDEAGTEKAPDESAEVQVINNGGEVIRIGDKLYYMNGQELYSDGTQLYVSKADDSGTWWIWRYSLDGSESAQLREGRILGIRDDKAYILRDEADGLYIDCVHADGTEELNIIRQPIVAEQITAFYAADYYLMFAAGHTEGSMGNYVGEFYSYDMVKGTLETRHLTDAKEFQGVDSYIYYQKYFNQGDGGNELYRASADWRVDEQVGEGLTLLAIDVENESLLVEKDGKLLRTQMDGSAEELLFDVETVGWTRLDGDRIQFSEVNIVEGVICVKAEQWAYTGEDGWRDSLIQSQHFRVEADGSVVAAWDPEALLADQEEKFAYLTNPVPGRPCADPAANGWSLYQWKDLRKQFSDWSYVPDPGTEDWTYLLENTDHYKLYGSGDYERMLLEYEGQYAEIHYPYTSNYMIPVDMVEYDYDNDGTPELSMKIQIKHGTGIYIDSFFMADLATDGLYVYQFLEEDIIAQLNGHFSCERTAYGLQALVDGAAAGPVLEDVPGQKPYERVSIGNQIRFYLRDERVHVSALLEFYTDDEMDVVFDSNDYDIRANVSYQDGGRFVLTEYESRNTAVEALAEAAAEDFYKEEFRIIDVRYDVHDTGGHASAVVLPEGTDSYDYLELELGGTWGNWTVENMYLEK